MDESSFLGWRDVSEEYCLSCRRAVVPTFQRTGNRLFSDAASHRSKEFLFTHLVHLVITRVVFGTNSDNCFHLAWKRKFNGY